MLAKLDFGTLKELHHLVNSFGNKSAVAIYNLILGKKSLEVKFFDRDNCLDKIEYEILVRIQDLRGAKEALQKMKVRKSDFTRSSVSDCENYEECSEALAKIRNILEEFPDIVRENIIDQLYDYVKEDGADADN
jgi:hypothetical protein